MEGGRNGEQSDMNLESKVDMRLQWALHGNLKSLQTLVRATWSNILIVAPSL